MAAEANRKTPKERSMLWDEGSWNTDGAAINYKWYLKSCKLNIS
jgi:hypothetical protein